MAGRRSLRSRNLSDNNIIVPDNCGNDKKGQKRKSIDRSISRGGNRGSRGAQGRGSTATVEKKMPDTIITSLCVGDVHLIVSSDEEGDGTNISEVTEVFHDSDKCDMAQKENRNNNIPATSKELHQKPEVDDCENEVPADGSIDGITPLEGFDPTITFSDSDDDLYSIDHNAIKASAHSAASEGLQRVLEKEATQLANQAKTSKPDKASNSSVMKEEPVKCHYISEDEGNDSFDEMFASPEVDHIKLSNRKMVKITKKTMKLFEKAEKIGMKPYQDLDLNDSKSDVVNDDSLLVLTEDDVNPLILMKVKHGLTYSKIPIRMSEKFGNVYQQLAETHGVSFDSVVLSLHDQVLSTNQTPADVSLTIVDIVECGIIRKKVERNEQSEVTDPNVIELKFQCSERRGMMLVAVNKFEKMSAAMKSYADKKEVNVNTLKFMFDGERLNPNETAIDLDLDGGECIDVYPV